MPFVLFLVGLTLLFASINNTQKDLFRLVQGDFTGGGSFIYWLVAIGIVGGVGYIPSMRGLSHAFLALILVVLILHQDPTKLFGGATQALAASTGQTPSPSNSNSAIPPLPKLPDLSALSKVFGT